MDAMAPMPAGPSRRIPGFRWVVAGLLLFSTLLSYLHRQTFAVAAPAIQEQFGLTNADIAHILNGFMIAYAVMHPVAGRIIDRLGTRVGLAVAVSFWSLANAAHALAGGLWSFTSARLLFGIGAAGNFPAAIKTVSEWFPPRERTFATGILNIGSSAGAVIAPPLVILLILSFGWRTSFVVTGAMGLIWVALWLLLYHPPSQHPRVTPEELHRIREEDAGPAEDEVMLRGAWKEALRSRNLWVLMASRLISDPTWFVYLNWLPIYLRQARGFSLESIACSAWIPYMGGILGSVLGGLLSLQLVRSGYTVLEARKIALGLCASVMPILILAARAHSAVTTLTLITIATVAAQAWAASALTLSADLLPKRIVAMAYGLTGMCGMLSAAFFNWVVGQITHDPGGFLYVFTIVGFLHPAAALLIVLLIRPPPVAAAKAASAIQ